jgi:hypothetical protein
MGENRPRYGLLEPGLKTSLPAGRLDKPLVERLRLLEPSGCFLTDRLSVDPPWRVLSIVTASIVSSVQLNDPSQCAIAHAVRRCL